MKIIVAGMLKTGTKSVAAALRILGYEVYDVMENMYWYENEWNEIFQKGFTTEKFHQMYKNVDVTIDIPACFFWEEIHRAFPEAKILLTVRDSEESWVKSIKNHVRAVDTYITGRIVRLVGTILQRKMATNISDGLALGLDFRYALLGLRTSINESILKMKYRVHNAHVLQNAPKGKLLVFNCKESWGPLCDFLDVPVPECSFPHENVSSTIIHGMSPASQAARRYKRELFRDFMKLLAKLAVLPVVIVFLANTFFWL